MTDPLESIAHEAEAGSVPINESGEAIPEAEAPGLADRVVDLFKPCPDDPATYAGGLSRFVNGALSKRSGVPASDIKVGENLAHCIEHVFPGGGSTGWPPILNLALSVLDYRAQANKHPDNGKLVRP